jgi:hypothetical protein
MYLFQDINKRYWHHFLGHRLLASGMILAIGVIGVALNYDPRIVFLALFLTLIGTLIGRVFLVQVDYTGGIKRKHAFITIVSIGLSAILIAWTYRTATQMAEPLFKRLVLPFLLANLSLTHLPFLIVHGVKRIQRRPLS